MEKLLSVRRDSIGEVEDVHKNHDYNCGKANMDIEKIVIPVEIENKIESKHNVRVNEIRQALINEPRIRFAEKGNVKGNDVYVAFGQTFGGRYLSVFFVYKPENNTSIIINARDMSKKERKAYGKK